MPHFKYGLTVVCAIRGPVEIAGMSNGPIPWPKRQAEKRSRTIARQAGIVNDALTAITVETTSRMMPSMNGMEAIGFMSIN
jgi:hypothetical protein